MKSSFIAGFIGGSLFTGGVMLALMPVQPDVQKTTTPNAVVDIVAQGSSERLNPNQVSTAQSNEGEAVQSEQQATPQGARSFRGNAQEADCNSACLTELSKLITTNEALSPLQWEQVRQNSDALAEQLSQDTAAVTELRDRLVATVDETQINDLLSLTSALPEQQALALIQDVALISSAHKIHALQALTNLSVHSPMAIAQIEDLVVGAQDPDVISAALYALESVDNQPFSAQTWSSLQGQLEYTDDAQLKSALLLSLSKHAQGDTRELADHALLGLSSTTADLQSASIESLRYLLARDDRIEALNSVDLSRRLNEVAANTDVQTSVRMNALMLLQEKFEESKKPPLN